MLHSLDCRSTPAIMNALKPNAKPSLSHTQLNDGFDDPFKAIRKQISNVEKHIVEHTHKPQMI